VHRSSAFIVPAFKRKRALAALLRLDPSKSAIVGERDCRATCSREDFSRTGSGYPADAPAIARCAFPLGYLAPRISRMILVRPEGPTPPYGRKSGMAYPG
jgi:hypothetical protein